MTSKVEKALEVLKQAMADDDTGKLGSYAHAWHCTIVTMCYDAIEEAQANFYGNESIDGHAVGNEVAREFIKLCFGVETTNDETGQTLEQLEKNVADAYADYYTDCDDSDDSTRLKAIRELREYLKEQDDEKLERLQKAVVDTRAAYDDADDAYAAADTAYDAAYADYTAAYAAWSKAKRELNNYLKEQDDEHSN